MRAAEEYIYPMEERNDRQKEREVLIRLTHTQNMLRHYEIAEGLLTELQEPRPTLRGK